MRKYHLSYDTKNCDKDFNGDHHKARRYVLSVIAMSGAESIESYNKSCIIINYPKINLELFVFLKINLKAYFNYSISLVGINNNDYQHLSFSDENSEQNDGIIEDWDALDLEEFKSEIRTKY